MQSTGTVQLTDTVSTSDDVVARVVAGETVLLNLATGTYFGLNEVGGRIWHLLDTEGCTLVEVAAKLQAEFEVSGETAEADVLSLMANLSEHGLVQQGA